VDWKEKLARAKALMEQIKAIGPDTPAEEKAKVPEMLEEIKQLKGEAGQLKDIALTAAELDEQMNTIVPERLQKQVKREQANTPQDDPEPRSEFKSWGEFLESTWLWATGQYKDKRLMQFVERDKDGSPVSSRKDLVENVGALGGFLVPVEFRAQLYSIMAEESFVRTRATVIPMRRRQIDIPVLDQTGATAGIPHWFGGMIFYWAEEATEKTHTDPNFRKIQLVAHKLIGYTRASDELLDDSAVSLEAFLTGPMGFAGGAVWHEEYCFLNGTGAGQPLGVINAGATITVPRAGAGAIAYTDLCDMLENFLPSGRGIWVITQSAMSDIVQINGPAGNPSYVWTTNAADGIPGTIFGMPVIWTEKVPRIGTAGDVGLYDWRYYLIGDRQAATVESTKFDRWSYDETSWRMVHRVDGQPWLSQPLTYQDGVTQVSPFVILGDAAT